MAQSSEKCVRNSTEVRIRGMGQRFGLEGQRARSVRGTDQRKGSDRQVRENGQMNGSEVLDQREGSERKVRETSQIDVN